MIHASVNSGQRIATLIKVLVLFALCLGAYIIPIHAFALIFTQPLEKGAGVYDDAAFIYSAISAIPCLLLIVLTPKYWRYSLYNASTLLFYIIFYSQACLGVVHEYRVLFGNTWGVFELFIAKVMPLWYFYVLAILGALWHTIAQRLIARVLINTPRKTSA